MSAETLTLPNQDEVIAAHEQAFNPAVNQELGDVALDTSVELDPHVSAELHVSEILANHAHTIDADDIAERFGLDTEQTASAFQTAETMQADARVMLRMPRGNFESFLGDGTYKSVFETNTTVGHGSKSGTAESVRTYQASRKYIEEEKGMTLEDGAPPLIYGYLDTLTGAEHSTQAQTYGDMAIVLKPEVTERSTFTVGDSMHPGSLLGPQDALVAHEANTIAKYAHSGKTAEYIESQIQGGITLDDVESLMVAINPVESNANNERWDSIQQIEDLLAQVEAKKPGLPVTVKIPASLPGSMSVKVFELAEQYPHATFVGLMKGESGQQSSPYQAEMRDINLGQDDPDYSDRVKRTAAIGYEQASNRQSEVSAKSLEIWQQRHPEATALPENIRFTTTA